MLRELHISNLAIIEDANVELAEGLNVFTGETGAGKSLLLGAFERLIGLKAGGGDAVRSGADEARVSGLFEPPDADAAAAIAEAIDEPVNADDQVLVTRKLFASGRSSVSINGRPATAAMVRAMSERLVDIHGQHDHQYLLKPANQLEMLDAYGGLTGRRRAFAEAFAQLRDLRRHRDELAASEQLRRQQLDLYEFQADEIDAADPAADEFAELKARHAVLTNVQRLQTEAGHAHAALYEAEGAAVDRLQAITQVLVDLAEIDEALEDVAEQVRAATLSLQDAAYELSRYVDRLEHDPAEAGEVDQRLNVLNRLISKYSREAAGRVQPGDDPLAPVLAYRAWLGEEIDRLKAAEREAGDIDARIRKAADGVAQLGGALSAARGEAAAELMPKVQAELKALGMADAELTVALDRVEADSDHAGPSGLDRVEVLVRTNPGQAAQPLRKIASGGELSRIMLALKSVASAGDGGAGRVSVLVFDEIDANIGGRLGGVIGRKLRQLTARGQQVLVITHLPQIAAFADRHFRIEKSVAGKGKARQTRTSVARLDDKARIDELAAMMAGHEATATTRKQARELVAAAAA